MAFETQEGLGNIAEKVKAISDELDRRRSEGLNTLFSPKAVETFAELATSIQSANQENLGPIAEAFETEIQEFGRHQEKALIDDVDSLRTMVEMFTDLSKKLAALSADDNSTSFKIAKIAHSTAEALNKKVGYLEDYLRI